MVWLADRGDMGKEDPGAELCVQTVRLLTMRVVNTINPSCSLDSRVCVLPSDVCARAPRCCVLAHPVRAAVLVHSSTCGKTTETAINTNPSGYTPTAPSYSDTH